MNVNFKAAVTILAGVLVFFINSKAVAGTDEKNTFVELQYAGKNQEQPKFRLAINDNSTAEYVITIKEANGDVLFSEKLNGKQTSRVYQLDSEDSDRILGTTFEVTNKTTNVTSVYKVSNISRTTVDTMAVTKL